MYLQKLNVTFDYDGFTRWFHFISKANSVKRVRNKKMITTALHFASVAVNTEPVPKPMELTVSQKYAILAGEGKNGHKIKSWVKKNYRFSYRMFEKNGWEPCPIKPCNLRKWQHRIKKIGGLSLRGVRLHPDDKC